jgi:hypothetical protein
MGGQGEVLLWTPAFKTCFDVVNLYREKYFTFAEVTKYIIIKLSVIIGALEIINDLLIKSLMKYFNVLFHQ